MPAQPTDAARPPASSLSAALAAHRWLIAAAVAASVVLFGVGIATGQRNLPVYFVVMTLGAAGVVALHQRVGLSTVTLWGLMVFGIGHLAGGTVPVGDGILYQWWLLEGWLRYDNLQHAWGFGFVGLAAWEALRHRLAPRAEDVGFVAASIILLAATGFGALNEVIEFVLTLTLAEANVGGYDNTARDLVANLTGGLVMAAFVRYRSVRQMAAELRSPDAGAADAGARLDHTTADTTRRAAGEDPS